MSEFDILRAAAAGMDAQDAALDVAARNVAAAEATPAGKAFERLVPRFAVSGSSAASDDSGLESEPAEPPGQTDSSEAPGAVDTDAAVEADPTNDLVWDVPDFRERPVDLGARAGTAGDLPVRYLGTRLQRGVDVDAVTEMVAVLDAQRAYESNASVFDVGKRLAERTIDVGRLS